VKSLSVQSTTLDDVFVHYTGRQLRDEQVKAFAYTGYVFGQEMR
jgi:ABC-2 type transport system ATP-binding protein